MTYRGAEPGEWLDLEDWGPPAPDSSLLALKQMYAAEVIELRGKVEELEQKLWDERAEAIEDHLAMREIKEILDR